MVEIVNSKPEMIGQLEAIQQACFPNLSGDELIKAEHYKAHIELFPKGQFAAITDDGNVVACSTDFITTIDLKQVEHRYIDIVANNWLSNHDPDGDWLYGADIGVHPDYRGRGISKQLYAARHKLVRQLNLKGHVAGGLLVGYGKVKHELSPETYVEKVKTGEVFDPTLSVQLKRGFTVHAIIQNYVDDPSCDNKAAFIMWRNPDYSA